MDELLSRLEGLTIQTVSELQELTEEQLLEFVRERGDLIDSMKALRYPEGREAFYRDWARRILQYDSLIMERMSGYQKQNHVEMNKIQNAKRQKEAYDADFTMDSVLFDKRK